MGRGQREGDLSDLLWTGEHWILYLRRPGEEANSGAVSLYRTAFSPAGEGTVALVEIKGPAGIGPAIYTDNPDLADFISNTVIKWSASPFPQGLPLVEARFTRGGGVPSSPEWRIEADGDVVTARWIDAWPPAVMDRPLQGDGKSVTHSVLFFSDEAEMTVNGVAVEGVPFVREDWKRVIGRPGTSSCFALSETMVATD
jgi:hypothetical protein